MKRINQALWWLAAVLECALIVQQHGGIAFAPPPFACDPGLHVMIVENAPARGSLPESQRSIMTSTSDDSLYAWMNRNCAMTSADMPAWHILDKDNPPTSDEQWAKDAFDLAKTIPPPAIVASNGKTGFAAQALPLTPGETVKLLEPLKARGK